MQCKKVRLSTFENWRYSHVVDPGDLARDGFYYTGLDDMVQCVFCTICLRKWEKGDIPSVYHENSTEECPFIKSQDVGNIPIDKDPRRIESPTKRQGNQRLVSKTIINLDILTSLLEFRPKKQNVGFMSACVCVCLYVLL